MVIWSSASWKVTPVRLTVTFLSRNPSSNKTFTPASLPRVSSRRCRLWSRSLRAMGARLRGESTGTEGRAAARSRLVSKSDISVIWASRVRILVRTRTSSSEADLFAGSYLEAMSSSSAAFSRSAAWRCFRARSKCIRLAWMRAFSSAIL